MPDFNPGDLRKARVELETQLSRADSNSPVDTAVKNYEKELGKMLKYAEAGGDVSDVIDNQRKTIAKLQNCQTGTGNEAKATRLSGMCDNAEKAGKDNQSRMTLK